MDSLNHSEGNVKTLLLLDRPFMYPLSTAAYLESLNLPVANNDYPASGCISEQQSHINCPMDCRLKINSCLCSSPKESIVGPNPYVTGEKEDNKTSKSTCEIRKRLL